jgi:hypothetical protein
MVKYRALAGVVALCFPLWAWAETFSAQVNKNSTALNETFNLRLKLEDAKSQVEPDLSALEENFQILGQQRSSEVIVIDGKTSSSLVWNLTLLPTHSGTLVIPSIHLDLGGAQFQTQPIEISVATVDTNQSEQPKERGITLTARTKDTEPYKDMRVLVNYELTTDQTLRNIQVGNLVVNDAIVEKKGEPKLENKLVRGVGHKVLTVSYWVTPLKEGVLRIPPLQIRAEVPDTVDGSSRRRSRSILGDQDEDDGSPFAEMHQMMQRFAEQEGDSGLFAEMRPILIKSSPLELKVLPAVPGMTPWLPATRLSLTESWSGDAQVGEPLSRTITTRAVGIASSQLPGFENQLSSNSEAKVYPEPPLKTEELVNGEIQSIRKDKFTIVPQKAGELRLPKIEVVWWDASHHTRQVATLSEKVLHVPATGGTVTIKALNEPLVQNEPRPNSNLQNSPSPRVSWLWLTLLMTALAVGAALLCWFFMRRKRAKAAPILLPRKKELRECQTVESVYQFLQNYSQAQWGTTPHAALFQIWKAAESQVKDFDIQKAKEFSRKMESALYGQVQVDVRELRSELKTLISKSRGIKSSAKEFRNYLPELNPVQIKEESRFLRNGSER